MKTPSWLLCVMIGATLLALAICWAVLPWPAAFLATVATKLGTETGMIGARWVDDRARTPGSGA